MQQHYIQAPYEQKPIAYHKGKVKRTKRAKKKDVPPDYRKVKWKLIKSIVNEIRWWSLRMKIGGKANV